MDINEIENHLDSLNIHAATRTELLTNPDRTAGWITWLREQTGIANPAGLLIAKYRTGDHAPDPNAWRTTPSPSGPDYPKALKACEALVHHTGHEYLEHDLLEELNRICATPRIGNGATLTDNDRARLLNQAARMRERHQASEHERATTDHAQATNYYRDLTTRITPKQAAAIQARLIQAGHPDLATALDRPPAADT